MSAPYRSPSSGPQPAPAYPVAPHQGYQVPPQAYRPPQQQPFAAQSVTQCRFCGHVPAVDVTFRGHRGMIVLMQFLHLRGPFCRDCGLSTFRSMTAKTLIQGWYGYASFLITPITVLINLARRGKVAKLPAPQQPPFGPSGRPMDPGPALLARPTALIGLGIPVLLIMLLVFVIAVQAANTP